MKKKLVLLSIVSILTLVGCNRGKSEEQYDIPEEEKIEYVEGKYIVEEGLSTYYVVTTKNPLQKELVAAQEFVYFMKEATGVDIPIVNEREVKGSYHYISLGNTTQFKKAFSDFDYSKVNNRLSAYYINTQNDNIYIVCGNDYRGYGVLYGVYDLLHDLVGYQYYHDTEIYFEEKTTVNLINYKNKFVYPSFDGRSISTLYTMNNAVHGQRLRILNNSRGGEWNRAVYGHNHIQLLLAPWELDENGVEYGKSHPDWFIDPSMPNPGDSVRGSMIENGFCYTAGHELEHVIAQRLVKYIHNEPESIYIMIAHEDTSRTCDCDRCRAAMEEWGGTPCGLQIDFTNHIIEECEEWLKENEPGREVQYLMFSYHATRKPPVKKDANGNYIPYSDRVLPHEKMRVFYAPIRANYAFPFSSPVNTEYFEDLDAWSAVAKNKIFMYLYDLNTKNYFVNFNNFGAVSDMYRKCQEIGATYMLTQGVSDTNTCCFDEMRSYVESSLMWDTRRSYEALADDFMHHFYKDAYSHMKEMYELVRDRYAYYTELVQQSTGEIGSNSLASAGMYPYHLVRKLDDCIKGALKDIEHLEFENYSLFTTLKNRVMKEYISVIYLKMMYYRSYYSESEIQQMIDDFNFYTQLFGIIRKGEGVPIGNLFN